MFSILKKARIPSFLHRKSNHIFTVWQHIVLLALRQYEDKSYGMFVEWLVEAYHLREFLRLSRIPHYTTLQKFASKINSILLVKIISSFILLLKNINNRLFVGIDASGFKLTNSSQYYTDRAKLRKKYLKLSLAADVVYQIICTIKIRRYPRNDTIDFQPLITKTSEILPISITVAGKGYDSEDNHILVREYFHGFSIIPARYEHVPIWRTHGKYRKQMKRGIPRMLYYQRNKNETIISVIKRLFGEHITSRSVRTQNRELSFRCIAYNTHRLTNLVIRIMIST